MKRLIPFILVFLTLLSCKTRYVTEYQTVEVPVIHTELRTDTLRDSIHVTDSVKQFINGDTVYNEKVRTVYKWRDRVEIKKKEDTITVVKPIPVEVEKPVPVPVEKELTLWQKIKIALGGIVMTLLGGFIIYMGIRLWIRQRTSRG